MTDEHILQLAVHANYAHLSIDRPHIIGPSQEDWQVQLPRLTDAQRATLVAKSQRYETMMSRERAKIS